jgi:hypothetical protein
MRSSGSSIWSSEAHKAGELEGVAPSSKKQREAQLQFNRWFQTEGRQATPPVEVLDSTQASVSETAAYVAAWIRARVDNV